MASFKVEAVVKGCLLGEGPHWDHHAGALYFSDVPGKFLHRYEPLTSTHHAAKTDTWASIIIPIEGMENKFLISNGRSLSIISWDASSNAIPTILDTLVTVEEDKPDNNFNDGKVDDCGRIWIGTMGPILSDGSIPMGRASLYSFGTKHQQCLQKHVSGLSVSNGISWSSDNRTMFYVDSPTRRVDVFDFDLEKGKLSNRRALFELDKDQLEGVPDGMAIDAFGKLWVATYGGGKVLHIDPNAPGGGKLLSTVPVPAEQVTSVTFGGPDFSDLYVTSSSKSLSKEEMAARPLSGSTFCIKELGVKGLPSNTFSWSQSSELP